MAREIARCLRGQPPQRWVRTDALCLVQEGAERSRAKTETVFTYDQRRRVRIVQTYRGPPSCWKVGQLDEPPPECKGYQAGELYGSSDPTTFPLLLEDTEFAYDNVDNPVELRDWRLPHEWSAGAKPVSKKAEYDDLYRLKRLDYVYAAGKDGWTSPFADEDAKAAQGGEVGIGEKPPASVLLRSARGGFRSWWSAARCPARPTARGPASQGGRGKAAGARARCPPRCWPTCANSPTPWTTSASPRWGPDRERANGSGNGSGRRGGGLGVGGRGAGAWGAGPGALMHRRWG